MVEGKIRHTKKCDADNLAKSILDALNGIAYYDDSQVCELLVRKYYSDNPRVEILISEI
jgi:Holliday junction resolvase RusA-like endonuclease